MGFQLSNTPNASHFLKTIFNHDEANPPSCCCLRSFRFRVQYEHTCDPQTRRKLELLWQVLYLLLLPLPQHLQLRVLMSHLELTIHESLLSSFWYTGVFSRFGFRENPMMTMISLVKLTTHQENKLS